MPIINMTSAKLSKSQKEALIKSYVEASMKITGAPAQAHTVIFQELPEDSMGIGLQTVEAFKASMKK